MTSTAVLLILVGLFVVINVNNFTAVLNKTATIGRPVAPTGTSNSVMAQAIGSK